MRDALHWFGYFVLVCMLFGWVEIGLTWMLCQCALDPSWFWAILGIPMSFNMCLSFLWLGAVQSTKEKKENARRRADSLCGRETK
jgi:hypothetical protein